MLMLWLQQLRRRRFVLLLGRQIRRQRTGDGDGDSSPHHLDEEIRRVARIVQTAVKAADPLQAGS
jgi:hypothetical protein